jgi:RNA recognition motif-containing protein
LPYDITAEHIRQVFAAFGPIRDITLPLDRENNNRPKGFVFIGQSSAKTSMQHARGTA